ncbi:MAG: AbrB/MazE/SpoVT family DNA-binding domain-containing protein [Eubacteriales bacterium]|nr:AbrB/MazE/SpoVT family DNA-binding domain-containing protein [Eubacteriales bacterium]
MKDKKNDRYFMASVKLGPKGQIVIPKEVREMFGVAPGDTMVLLADRKKGVALQTVDKLNPMLRSTFNSLMDDEEDEEA